MLCRTRVFVFAVNWNRVSKAAFRHSKSPRIDPVFHFYFVLCHHEVSKNLAEHDLGKCPVV